MTQILGNVADCDVNDVNLAIESANAAQQEYYSSTTAAERGKLLRKWYDLVMANVEILGTILCLENGKTMNEAKGEIVYAPDLISWFAEEATRSYGDTIPSSMHNTMVITLKEPVGVCGIITPWNFPAAMITRKVAPDLAAGCSVVIKPSSETPFTCIALTKLAVDAGMPSKIIHTGCVGAGDKSTCSQDQLHWIHQSRQRARKTCHRNSERVSLELGGNAPFIVFDDADIDLAVEGAMVSKFRCSGQTSICANRLYVQQGVVKEFTEKLVKRVSQLQLGPGVVDSCTQGPLINSSAIEKVKEHISDALAKGAQIEIGGSAPEVPGCFIEPTVLTGATEEMIVAQEETFGPLAPIFAFEDEEKVIKLANLTEFGLAGYFFSRDIGRAMRVAQKLKIGMCGVNTGKISAPESPFGGIKESGYGLEGSKYGTAEYQVVKTITLGNLHL
ncbi:hypothetical protein Asppvi_005410 [Aspergillus pseudoviridinutans]|uniref:Aldehyde dehydrogenase domain-containing protein n=1 Tax=Aspergillus pseudoviridinutans TaxID=1517512 RepID=A0A9P3B875_9EURO|nr:uncharacterized protein Asppvi_005410 [Aspergillus pseudoviridinutans]GIJ86521.1 hypothetical protein Asppvi_005410 [Aspergillus pseudoviridinutans]